MAARTTKATIAHEEIRRWAERRRARPAEARGTSIIRLAFPGFTGEEELEAVSWDEWFQRFDDGNLALVYQEKTKDGRTSNFNKLVGRETVDLKTAELVRPPRRRAPPSTPRRATEKAEKRTAKSPPKKARSSRTTARRA